MPKNCLNWKVAGPAGEGIKTTGLLFSKLCLRSGLYTFDYTEYPSLIRGGHNTYQVMAGMQKIYSQEQKIDVLIALNKNAVEFHQSELTPESVVIYDGLDGGYDANSYSLVCPAYNVPLVTLAKEAGGERLMFNNVALGVSAFLFNLDITVLDTIIKDIFGGKGEAVVSLNQKCAHAGFDYAAKNLKPLAHISVQKQAQVDNISLVGNEACALGLIAGGLKAYIAYPMTPSSTILHALADWEQKANIFVKHAEDEIGVINMALGMSFAGVRAAVGTSGGGLCYMTEAVGFAGVAELPLVIIDSMRPGPALGMPTWTAQGDLLFTITMSQDEFPRIILAPGDVLETFELSRLSMDLAEQYQLPVVILLDKHLSESAESTHIDQTTFSVTQTSINHNPTPNETGFYPRYTPTENGVSLRTLPGQPNGMYLNNSYEHDIQGLASEESKDRIAQVDKRAQKLVTASQNIPTQYYDGSDNPQITFISFGSTKWATRAAAEKLRAEGIDAAVFNLSWIWPFPADQVANAINKSQNPIVVEGNQTHQLATLIRQQTGIDVYHKRTKYDGRPLYPEELVAWAKEIINK